MPKVAPQHQPGHPMPLDTDHQPSGAWPAEARVQWGDGRSFMIHGGRDAGGPAFFEAFLADGPGVSFRGEGASITAAETSALRQHAAYLACGPHDWTRMHSAGSGVGCCSRCGAVGIRALPEVRPPVDMDGPLTVHELERVSLGLLHPDYVPRGNAERFAEECAAIRAKAMSQGLRLPAAAWCDDAYRASCEMAVGAFWHRAAADYAKAAEACPDAIRRLADPLAVAALDANAATYRRSLGIEVALNEARRAMDGAAWERLRGIALTEPRPDTEGVWSFATFHREAALLGAGIMPWRVVRGATTEVGAVLGGEGTERVVVTFDRHGSARIASDPEDGPPEVRHARPADLLRREDLGVIGLVAMEARGAATGLRPN